MAQGRWKVYISPRLIKGGVGNDGGKGCGDGEGELNNDLRFSTELGIREQWGVNVK